MSDVKPGMPIDLFYYSDYEQENIRVMHSVVYDIQEDNLVIAQPSPGILRSSIKKDIAVTFLIRCDEKTVRLGFPARIKDFISDYRLSAESRVSAVTLKREGIAKPFNIRFHFRVNVPSSSSLTMMITGERASLIDISLGGAMISGNVVKKLNPRDRIKTTLRLDDQSYVIDALVLRKWSPTLNANPQTPQCVALKFLSPPVALQTALGKEIFKIERQFISGHTSFDGK